MQEKIIKKKVREGLAISEIILLITSIIAFSCLLGNSFSVVSAQEEVQCVTVGKDEVRVSDIMATIGPGKDYDYSSLWGWCVDHGGSDVCKGGSEDAELITHSCLAQTPIPPPASVLTIPTDEVIGKVAEEIVKEIREGEPEPTPGVEPEPTPTTEKEPTGFAAIFGRLLLTGKSYKAVAGPLIFSVIAIGLIMLYTYISTLIKTGDSARALEAAIRVGVGAAIGAIAGYLVVAVLGGPAGWIIAAFMILGALLSSWLKREQDREIAFTCKPWQAQTGGTNCELCDDQDFPCTEYQCRSLGTGCELINKDTDEPRCIWRDPRDVTPPNITAWVNALTEGYEYVPLIGQYGVEIKYTDSDDGCLPAFQPFTFGVELDKNGYCRIEKNRTAKFSDMRYDFGGRNLYIKNHTQQMTFMGVANLEREGIILTNGGELEFYVRCEAASSGRANRDEFIFKLCIDKGPDTTSPEIRSFNWPDGAPIAYFEEDELREIDIEAYVNEPAQCKWSHEDKSYENMENNLTCPNSLSNFNAQLSYTCFGKLTGLENNRENKFFFRCNDSFGNVNIQSRTLTLIGTQPLFISSVEPNATTIKGATNIIKVTLEAETSAGYQDGKAICEYSNTGTSGSYVLFSNTDSHQHSENVWLGPGDYNYFIRCFDLAGNSDIREISFTVETDTTPPIVVRVFRDGLNLKIITNEEASCVYDNIDCLYDFEDGIGMATSDDKVHSITWDSNKNFYIKCQDLFGNQPAAPQSCSIIVRPFEI